MLTKTDFENVEYVKALKDFYMDDGAKAFTKNKWYRICQGEVEPSLHDWDTEIQLFNNWGHIHHFCIEEHQSILLGLFNPKIEQRKQKLKKIKDE